MSICRNGQWPACVRHGEQQSPQERERALLGFKGGKRKGGRAHELEKPETMASARPSGPSGDDGPDRASRL